MRAAQPKGQAASSADDSPRRLKRSHLAGPWAAPDIRIGAVTELGLKLQSDSRPGIAFIVEVSVVFKNMKQKLPNCFGGRQRPLLLRCMILLFLVFSIEPESRAQSELSPSVDHSTVDSLPAKIQLVDGSDIRFRRLPAGAGLSQTRVNWVVQDKVGFIWFGTQYGLNR